MQSLHSYRVRMVPLFAFLLAVFPAGLSSCFTGIEGTKKIELSRADMKRLRATSEDTILAAVRPRRVGDLHRGDRFRITDSRIALFADIIRPQGDTALLGREITFEALMTRLTPSNTQERIIQFSDGPMTLSYPLGRGPYVADSLPSDRLPLLLDMDMVARADSVLRGLKVWTRTSLAYDSLRNRRRVLKFAPMTITDVMPGDDVFPLRLRLHPDDPDAGDVFAYLNFGAGRGESRPFRSQFFLSDPRLTHPDISETFWKAIMAEKVIAGMTKAECRLALGEPAEVDTGHDYSRLIDIWIYPDGTFLRFVDGVLSDSRQ